MPLIATRTIACYPPSLFRRRGYPLTLARHTRHFKPKGRTAAPLPLGRDDVVAERKHHGGYAAQAFTKQKEEQNTNRVPCSSMLFVFKSLCSPCALCAMELRQQPAVTAWERYGFADVL